MQGKPPDQPQLGEAAAPTPSGLLALLCAITFLTSLNDIILSLLLPDLARDLGVSVSTAGQLATATMLTGAVVGLAVGVLSDLYGRRPFLIAGAALLGIASLAVALAPTFAWALVGRVLAGFGGVGAITMALAGDLYRGGARDRAVGRLTGMRALSRVLGLPAIGLIAQWAGWRAGIGAYTAAVLAAAALAPVALPSSRDHLQKARFRAAVTDILDQHRHRPDLAGALLANALLMSAFSGFSTYAGAFYAATFGLAIWQIATVFAFTAGAFVVGTELAGRGIGRVGAVYLATLSTLGMALLYAGILVAPTLAIAVGFHVIGAVCFAGAITSTQTLVLGLATRSRGATMALSGTLSSLGGALAVSLGGLLLAGLGYQALTIVVAFFCLSSLGLIRVAGVRLRPAPSL